MPRGTRAVLAVGLALALPALAPSAARADEPVITAPGTFNDEVGCAADWDPACPAAQLAYDPATGVYAGAFELPAGDWEFKIAQDGSWDTNWGADGVAGGANMTFTTTGGTAYIAYSPSSHQAKAGPYSVVEAIAHPALPGSGEARAIWLAETAIAWPTVLGDAAELRFELPHHPEATVVAAGKVTADQVALDPRVAGYDLLYVETPGAKVSSLTATERLWHSFLSAGSALEVAAYRGDDLVARTGVQIGPLLDAVFGEAAGEALGVVWTDGTPTLRLWAPTAQSVTLLLWTGGAADPRRVAATLGEHGVWDVAGEPGWKDAEYLWEVTVFVPSLGEVVANRVTDPYSVALTVDSARSVLADLDDPAWAPALWTDTPVPAALRTQAAQTIYELHIRDFSAADPTVPEAWRGTYKAFTVAGSLGVTHLRELAEAGITTVHLLPSFDIASIPEDRATQVTPVIPAAAADAPDQQAAVAAVADRDAFNWGYDPWHWGVPEGSYATAGAQDGGARTAEFREMVGALHGLGLRVVLDQVFNHTAASGQSHQSVLDRIVPGYYHRLSAAGAVENSTCCSNIAVERVMAGQLVVDTVVLWAKAYHVDGFRFDIMGHHPLANLVAVRAALDALTMEQDGVDGQAIYLYGEAWNFGEVQDDRLFTQARQAHIAGTGIGTFNDRLRDAVRGGGPFDDDQRAYQGFATGLATDPNGFWAGAAAEQAADLLYRTGLVRLSLAGCLADVTLPDPDGSGAAVLGRDILYGGQPAGYTAEPQECVNYVDAHDNETLYDNSVWKLPVATPLADRVRLNTLALATTALGQAPSFWHAGTEILRSKSLDRNSYNAGDHFNAIDWTLAGNAFGTGLPPAADNETSWPAMAPLLADPALKPTTEAMAAAYAQALDLLRLRSSTPLFTLGSTDLIRARVSFPNAGPNPTPGLLVLRIDDPAGSADADLDPSIDTLLVVFNASPQAITEAIDGLAGRSFTLHPVQRDGADPVVQTTAWDTPSGTITLPARTVAVLIETPGQAAKPWRAALALAAAALAGLAASVACRRFGPTRPNE